MNHRITGILMFQKKQGYILIELYLLLLTAIAGYMTLFLSLDKLGSDQIKLKFSGTDNKPAIILEVLGLSLVTKFKAF
jgi:hypothetical protein